MTVIKNPIPIEDMSEHTSVASIQSDESIRAGIQGVQPPQILIGKRQFMRPVFATRQSALSAPLLGAVALTSQSPSPAKRQFLGPAVLSRGLTEVPVVRIPDVSPLSVPVGQQMPFTRAVAVAPVETTGMVVAELPAPVVASAAVAPVVEKERTFQKRWRREKRTQQQQGKKTRRKRIRRLLVVVSLLTVIAVVFFSQGNGAVGAWLADTMRAVLGPTITAQVESWYLSLSDTTHNIQYQLGGQHVDAPWSVGTLPPTPVPPPTWSTLKAMPLTRIAPVISPALTGEGVWAIQEQAPAPYNYLPLDAKAFIRPDPTHPYAIVTMLQFDMRFINLHMVAGTTEPGGAIGHDGPGVIPSADQQGNTLLAAFNGGFKYADGQYGMMANGVVYVPPQNGVATIAVTKEGKIMLGAWGSNPTFSSSNRDLVAWRQNAALLINNGVINPLTSDGSAWGGTILNSSYTWRSGLGITASGTLIYAAGDYLTALTLGQALKAAGAVMAMQTDINPYWVRAFLYSRNSGGAYNISKLNPAMQGTGTEYLYGNERDFFYLTRYSPPPPPQPAHARETYPQ